MQQLEQMTPERYQIQRLIAHGGMATIYLAYDSERDETVAIKVVHSSANEYYDRFSSEAHAMFTLQHEHILSALDYGEYKEWSYLVTPYIENGTLTHLLANGPLSLYEADNILGQIANALQYAHAQGILHRDIKPSNVLMRDNSYAYLADFGLVKRVGEENHLTVTGFLIGTPEYMAPELADAAASPQSDVYALGVLLYQMISGRVPFTGNTPMATYLKHIRDVPPPISSINPDIPTAVEHVMTCALDKDPRRRYQSAQELYEAYHQSLIIAEQQHQDIINQTTATFIQHLPMPNVTIKKRQGNAIHKHVSLAALAASVLLVVIPALVLWASIASHQALPAHAVSNNTRIHTISPTPSFDALATVTHTAETTHTISVAQKATAKSTNAKPATQRIIQTQKNTKTANPAPPASNPATNPAPPAQKPVTNSAPSTKKPAKGKKGPKNK